VLLLGMTYLTLVVLTWSWLACWLLLLWVSVWWSL
jgi:hypothetical protein